MEGRVWDRGWLDGLAGGAEMLLLYSKPLALGHHVALIR